MEVFKDGITTYIKDAAHCAGSPVDYVACSLLSGAITLIGSSRWATPWEGWAEPGGLWIALVGEPSSNKSSGIDPIMEMLRGIEAEMAQAFQNEYAKWEGKKLTAEYAREKWKRDAKQAVEDGKKPSAMPDAAIEPQEIVCPRLIVNDSSIEKAAILLAIYCKGFLYYRDELAGFIGAFDRYGGKGAERAFWIEGYGGRSYIVDRVKHKIPIQVPYL